MGAYRRPYTIFKRGKYYYYRTYDKDGYRTVAKTTGKTSKIAAMQYCEELHLSGSLTHAKYNFFDYAHDFFAPDSLFVTDRSRRLSMNTINHYRSALNAHIMPRFKNYDLADITYSELKAFRSDLLKDLTTSSVNNIMAAFTAIIKTAYYDNLIKVNPLDRLEPLRVTYRIVEPFTLEEVKALCDNVVNYKPLFILLACTGMRISEAIGVTDEDFKKKKNYEYIELNKQYDSRRKEYTPPKKNSCRNIPIIPELKDCIQPFIPYPTICSAFQEAKIKAGINNLKTIHCFRHFFVSDTKSKELNPIKIEYIAGHSLRGIEKVYTKLDFEDMAELLLWQKNLYEYLK